MKTKTILLTVITLCLMVGGAGCEKKDILPLNQAKGKILFITGPCEGNAVYIEVDNPKGIGKKGSFSFYGSEIVEYENLIDVPFFYRINLPVEFMKKDTWLHFEYREVTEEDIDKGLFEIPPTVCLWYVAPPQSTSYIITKIIAHKP